MTAAREPEVAQDPAHDVREEWIYLGERLDRKGKAIYAWLDHEGNERWYGSVLTPGAAVGGVYLTTLTANGQVLTGATTRPLYVRASDDARRAHWQAEHQLTRTLVEAQRAGAKAKKEAVDGIGTMTLDDIARWYSSRATPEQRAGVMTVVLQYLQRPR